MSDRNRLFALVWFGAWLTTVAFAVIATVTGFACMTCF